MYIFIEMMALEGLMTLYKLAGRMKIKRIIVQFVSEAFVVMMCSAIKINEVAYVHMILWMCLIETDFVPVFKKEERGAFSFSIVSLMVALAYESIYMLMALLRVYFVPHIKTIQLENPFTLALTVLIILCTFFVIRYYDGIHNVELLEDSEGFMIVAWSAASLFVIMYIRSIADKITVRETIMGLIGVEMSTWLCMGLLIYFIMNQRDRMKRVLEDQQINELHNRFIELESEISFLKDIRHDLEYMVHITNDDKLKTDLEKTINEIDEHPQYSSFNSCLLHSLIKRMKEIAKGHEAKLYVITGLEDLNLWLE